MLPLSSPRLRCPCRIYTEKEVQEITVLFLPVEGVLTFITQALAFLGVSKVV